MSSSQVGIATAFCSDPPGLLEMISLPSCDSVANERDTGGGSLVLVDIS